MTTPTLTNTPHAARRTAQRTAQRTARRGAPVAALREEAFHWFRYGRFVGASREAAAAMRDEAIGFSRRLGARGLVLPAEIELEGSAVAARALRHGLEGDGHAEVLLRYRTEQAGLDVREYAVALIDVRADQAALTLGRLGGEAVRWLLPLLRDYRPLRAFVLRQGGSLRVAVAVAGASGAARAWLEDYEARKARRDARYLAAIEGKEVAPVFIRRCGGAAADGRTWPTGTAEGRLQGLSGALGRARPGTARARRLQREVDALTAEVLHRRHRALAAQDTELAHLPTVEDWLREETWARDEAGPHRPAYLEELSGADRHRVAAYR